MAESCVLKGGQRDRRPMLGCTFEDVDGRMGEDERVSRE